MAMPSFAEAQAGYAALWASMEINPERLETVTGIAHKLYNHKTTYETVQTATTVPWFVVALIDELEGGGNANTHLHNGDSLSARTVHVPAGRPPPPDEPPFTFFQSAVDALRLEGFDRVSGWGVERIGWELEKYNGSGYFGVNINSPYLWSYTNHYTAGKFVSDGQYDPAAVSRQAGAMAILKALINIDPAIMAVYIPGPLPKPVPVPVPEPIPVPPTTTIPPSQSMLGLSLQQWAAALAKDPSLIADAAKLTPDALVVVERIIKATQ